MSTIIENFAAQFSRTYMSEADFSEAYEYLDCHDAAHNSIIQRGLLVAAIVAYARPFTSNKGSGKAAASIALDLNALLSTRELELHNKLLSLRHQALAHSDYAMKAAARVSGDERGFIVQARMFDVTSEGIGVLAFKQLCGLLKARCTAQLRGLNYKLVSIEAAA